MESILESFSGRFWPDGISPEGLVCQASPAAYGFLAAAIFYRSPKSVVVIAPDSLEAENLSQEAALFLGSENVVFFPDFETIPYDDSRTDLSIISRRLRCLHNLNHGQQLVFTSAGAIMRQLPEPAAMNVTLQPDLEFAPLKLSAELMHLGYKRCDRVETQGEFSLKGSIIDVFPVQSEEPVRIDFFDDLIESLRRFDPESQIGGEKIQETVILPAGEIVLLPEQTERLKKRITEDFQGDLLRPDWIDSETSVWAGHDYAGLENYFPLIEKTVSFFDLFDEKPQIVCTDIDATLKAAERLHDEFEAVYAHESMKKVCLKPEQLLFPDIIRDLQNEGMVYFFESDPAFLMNGPDVQESLDEKATGGIVKAESASPEPTANDTTTEAADNENSALVKNIHYDKVYAVNIRRSQGFQGRIRDIKPAVGELLNDENCYVIITSPYPAQLHRLAGIFKHEGLEVRLQIEDEAVELNAGELLISRAAQREGFSISGEQSFTLLTDSDVFGRSYRRRSRFKKSSSTPIHSFIELKENDFVVHINHGIGRFIGLERVSAAGRERDFLILEYAEQDRLFVPLDQISMVQKYVAPTENPRLDHLGKASFKKVRERVEKKIEEFAEELIEIYAARMARKGYAFPADTIWQEEFEADFPYDETPDQLAAIDAVKNDMETGRPMDRLICGDVGYGKTEVAIRAAFKAVMAGKQVAVICPTTILAFQHFQNFSERFQNYPIKVDWVSRFRSQKETTAVKRALTAGEVDVVIGTHALLSKKMLMRDPGLLIIDEEQRFGVVHKETLKSMKKLIDVLTLSATPIPRTLHLSLVGIRDLSIIQTPPRDRLPVKNYVLSDSDSVLTEAIHKELERKGQVFYLHNRIQTIDAAAARVEALVPEARIAVMHGQMDDNEIEDILLDFTEKRYDILVTTAIIENGIDIPNVNTLIVDRADMFGLSQLYQIRGRVGRSNRQAYAYFFHAGSRVLTEQAQKRLNTLLEHEELGSGFKVAMRDLEIRGAGNVLGTEQSGDIMEVGYELYVKLLEDAVRRLQGEKVESDYRAVVSVQADFFLPEDYIVDTRQRIEFYKRFESCKTEQEIDSVASEMEDRFGTMPETAATFVLLERIRVLASAAGFEKVIQEASGRVLFIAGDYFQIPPEKVIDLLKRYSILKVLPGNQNTLFFDSGENNAQVIMEILRIMLDSERASAEFEAMLLKLSESQAKKVESTQTSTKRGAARKTAKKDRLLIGKNRKR